MFGGKMLKNNVIKNILKIESELYEKLENINVRDDVIGPIVDTLHDVEKMYEKKLSNGLIFQFKYSSKISRDFILSNLEYPDTIYEPQTTKLLLHLAKFSGDFLIGGAYIGDHAILIANKISKNAKVCCFEANKKQFKILEKNIEINKIKNIDTCLKALWHKDDILLSFNDDDAYTIVGDYDSTKNKVETITIDSYCKSNNLNNLNTILLDIEGSEINALSGAKDTLSNENSPNIIFEINSSFVDWSNGLKNTSIIKNLNDYGYKHIFAIRDFQSNIDMSGCKIELIPIDSIYLPNKPHGFNLIATKNLNILHDDNIRFVDNVSPKLLKHEDKKYHQPSEWGVK